MEPNINATNTTSTLGESCHIPWKLENHAETSLNTVSFVTMVLMFNAPSIYLNNALIWGMRRLYTMRQQTRLFLASSCASYIVYSVSCIIMAVDTIVYHAATSCRLWKIMATIDNIVRGAIVGVAVVLLANFGAVFVYTISYLHRKPTVVYPRSCVAAASIAASWASGILGGALYIAEKQILNRNGTFLTYIVVGVVGALLIADLALMIVICYHLYKFGRLSPLAQSILYMKIRAATNWVSLFAVLVLTLVLCTALMFPVLVPRGIGFFVYVIPVLPAVISPLINAFRIPGLKDVMFRVGQQHLHTHIYIGPQSRDG